MDRSLVEYASTLGVDLRILRKRANRDAPMYSDDLIQDTLLYVWTRLQKGSPVGADMAYRRTLDKLRTRTRRHKNSNVDIGTLE